MDTNVLEITDLRKVYDEFVLDGVSFRLPRGHIMGIIGPNGAGKTTTLKLIMNFIRKDGGDIRVFGMDPAVEEKRVIGELAGGLVRDGDQIFLDSGTSCSAMVPHLKKLHGVTVLTNSARLALELNAPGLSVFLIGGEYRPDRMDTVGPMAMSTLNQVRGYVAFIGADGLSMDFGPSASDVASAHLHRVVVENSREAVLLVDSSKFGGASLFQIVDWSRISKIVTDRRPDEQWKRFFAERNIELITPVVNDK